MTDSFATQIFTLLAARPPAPAEAVVFEQILNLAIDHGPETPSARATIAAAQSSEPIGAAVAAGVREINQVHGGAQELTMPLLYRMVKEKVSSATLVAEYVREKKRLPGFGHRLYKEVDPRAELILKNLETHNLGGEYITAARELARELAQQTGKTLPLNIDGAIAVALCTFDWPAQLGQAVFIIARTPGLCRQFINTVSQV